MDMVAGAAKVAPTKKAKSADTDILTHAPDAVKADISKIIKAKATMKKAKSEVAVAEKSILDFGTQYKNSEAFDGRFKKSYKIAGNGKDKVTFVTANKFSFNTDDVGIIKEILGAAADEMLPSEYKVSIKQEVFTDDAKQKELMELLGARWNDFFDTTVAYKVSDDFDSRIYKELDENGLNDLNVYCKQSKPSVRG
jgi:hypothetical protein